MKIAFFADAFPDLSVTFVLHHIVGMLDRGHDVTVYAQRAGRVEHGQDISGRWDLSQRTRYMAGPAERKRRMFVALKILLSRPFEAPTLLQTLPPFDRSHEAVSLKLFFAASTLRQRAHYDVIHCHFGPNGNLAVGLRNLGLLSGPVVTTFHGYDIRWGRREGGRCYDHLRTRGDAFLAISRENRKWLETWGFPSNKILDHPVGVDLEAFPFRGARAKTVGPLRLLTVANLVTVKGHDILLKALHDLIVARPDLDIELRLVGSGPLRSVLEEQVHQFGLSNRVTFVGGLPHQSISEEMRQADIFVLPSRAEATPVALMEAQAIGLPVIATLVGAVNEVVKDRESGLLVPPEDPRALRHALEELLTRQDDWEAMGRAGRRHVSQHFDLSVLLDRLEDIYEAVRVDHARSHTA